MGFGARAQETAGSQEPLYGNQESLESRAKAIIASMPVEDKIGQLFAVQCFNSPLTDTLLHMNPSGLLMFATHFNGLSAEDIRTKIEWFRSRCDYPLIVMTDEEGGRVCRVSCNPNIRETRFLTPKYYYNIGGIDSVLTIEREKAVMLDTLGINLNLAPVADITGKQKTFMSDRSLGLDPVETADVIGAIISQRENQLAARPDSVSMSGLCLKHFPGYGSCNDTHAAISICSKRHYQMMAEDIVPFMAGIEAGADMILVAHITMLCLDSVPTSISPATVRLLRDQLGYKGVIMTDDLTMKAIRDNYDHPYLRAFKAGFNLIMISDMKTAYKEIEAALDNEEITEEQIDQALLPTVVWKLRHIAE